MSPTEAKTKQSATTDTREQLLDAAERLIGEQGIDRASVRQITELANANLAAVSYHFGSKNGLVREVFERRLRPINRERLTRLADCLDKSGTPELECIVRAFVEPPFRVLRGEHATNFGRCMVRAMSDPGPEMRDRLMETFDEVIQRFARALELSLPGVEPNDIFWRFHFMLGAMAYTVGMGHLVPEYSRGISDNSNVDAIVEQLVRFITAGIAGEPKRRGA